MSPSTSDASGAGLMRIWNGLSRGEQLALGGAVALLVIGEWLLADLLDGPGIAISGEIAAAELVLLVLAHAMRPGISWPLPFAMLLAATAAVIVVPTISEILSDVRNPDVFSGSGLSLLTLLFDWACAAVIAAGAWMVWRSDTR